MHPASRRKATALNAPRFTGNDGRLPDMSMGYVIRVITYAVIHIVLLMQVSNDYWIGNVWSMRVPMLLLGFPLSLLSSSHVMDHALGWLGFLLLGLNSLLWGLVAWRFSWRLKQCRTASKAAQTTARTLAEPDR
jgi:hypothetical protein